MLEREAYMWLGHMTTFRQGDVDKLFLLFESASEIYKNLYEDADVLERLVDKDVLKAETAKEIKGCDTGLWDRDLKERMRSTDVKAVTPADDTYPSRLRDIPDKPLCLYYRGDISIAETEHIVAIIGSRRVSSYGMKATDQFSRGLSNKGITIVSGMAYGVDGKAHRSCIEEKGKTIAVLGGGVDICYPRTNLDIYLEMCENHLVLSEYEPGEAHKSLHFPARNRIISGLADGVLVTEAALKSGTMITVDRALEQGRTVYAVPGRMTDLMSKGTNNLIKQGAILVDSTEDIVRDMIGLEESRTKQTRRNSERQVNLADGTNIKNEVNLANASVRNQSLNEKEKSIIGMLGYEPVFIDDLIRSNGMNIGETLGTLRHLEGLGLIVSVENSYYVLKK